MRNLQVTIKHTPTVTQAIERYVSEDSYDRKGGRKKKACQMDSLPVDKEQAAENRRCSIANSRRTFKDIIHANFKHNFCMLTLTFRRTHEFNTKDFYACRDKFNLFWKSLKRCKKLATADLRYVGAIEFQGNGNVHFHILCHIPPVFKPLLVEKWKYGGLHYTNNKGSAEDASKIASYLSKGIHDERLPAGKKRYLGGYGLERPTTLQFKTRKVFDLLMQRNGKVLTTYESDYGFTVTSLLSDATIDELQSFAATEDEDINLALLEKLQSIQYTQQGAI